MASRAILHKSKISEFKNWLTTKHVNWRDADHDWQVIQIRAKNSRGFNAWMPIYDNLHSEHLTVPQTLVALVRTYLADINPRLCPNCGSDCWRNVTNDMNKYATDRICSDCETRYSIIPRSK